MLKTFLAIAIVTLQIIYVEKINLNKNKPFKIEKM